MHSYYVYIYTHSKTSKKALSVISKMFLFWARFEACCWWCFPFTHSLHKSGSIPATSIALKRHIRHVWAASEIQFPRTDDFLINSSLQKRSWFLELHCQSLCKFKTKVLLYWSMQGKIWLVSWLMFSTSSISFLPRGKVLFSFGLLVFLILSAAFLCRIWARQGTQACMLCKAWLSTSPPPLVNYPG